MNYRKENGQALVEFALILPLLLIVMFGAIEFGLVLYNQAVITNASREGARAGIVQDAPRKDIPYIQGIVNSYCLNHLVSFQTTTPNTTAVSSAPNWNLPSIDHTLTVTVTYNYTFLVFPRFISFGNPFQLRAETVMHYE